MASRLQDVILRGLSTAKPAASTVAPGTLYFSSDTHITERSNGTLWESYTDAGTGGGGGGAPAAHAPTHKSGGTDPIKLDELAAPTDVTTLNASTTAHGLQPKLPGNTTTFLRGDGTFAAPPGGSAPTRYGAIIMNIDGNGSVITTGFKGALVIPFQCTILDWSILSTDPAKIAGSIVIDVWRSSFAGYPPSVINSITGGSKATLSSVNHNTGSVILWSTAVSPTEVLAFNVDSVALVTKVVLVLKIQLV